MSLNKMLDILAERGLCIEVESNGTPHIRGPREEVTDAVKEVLCVYRDEIIARFKPKVLRRIVLLSGDRDSEVDRVLWEGTKGEEHGRYRELASNHKGKTVAVEHAGKIGWTRYLWILIPEESNGQSPTPDA